MQIRDFGVEIWMNAYETKCKYNIAETCVYPLTVEELLDMSGQKEDALKTLCHTQMTYGDIEGAQALREEIAKLYETAAPDQVLTAHGAIGANHLVMETIVERGDHVISVLPTYQQHYSIPEALGADVSILRLRAEQGWRPDLDELRSLMQKNTKLICINNPNNPSGSIMDEDCLRAIVSIAKEYDAYVLCDEVYRGLNHEGDYFTKSIVDLYEKGISTGSMSKTFSLAGLRLGWIVSPKDLHENITKRRDYNTISCGVIDEQLAALALKNKDKILSRNRAIVNENLAILDAWIQVQPHFHYVKPKAGTTAFVQFDYDMPSETFCKRALDTCGVMLVPGTALDVEGYLRFGYANKKEEVEKGLEELSAFVKTLSDVPLKKR